MHETHETNTKRACTMMVLFYKAKKNNVLTVTSDKLPLVVRNLPFGFLVTFRLSLARSCEMKHRGLCTTALQKFLFTY